MKRGLQRARRPGKDVPFAQFLEGAARNRLDRRARTFARSLVEGFDAADAERVSTLEILDEWSGAGAADAPTFRPHAGYGALIHALHGLLDPDRVQLRLNTRVREVHWSAGEVQVNCERAGRPLEMRAQQAIVTLPLGVLQQADELPEAVRFVPSLASKRRAMEGLAVGPVIKVVLQFSAPFWEEAENGRHRDVAFFLAPGFEFPTFWTTLPVRTSLLTAWSAGPNAARLTGRTETTLVDQALASLQTIFGRTPERLLERAYVHDWQADPCARGAYSYVTAGGSGARRALARPLAATLYFAGEATDTSGEAATVFGALESGRRAARQVLAAR
jgi:monoamine oxidase